MLCDKGDDADSVLGPNTDFAKRRGGDTPALVSTSAQRCFVVGSAPKERSPAARAPASPVSVQAPRGTGEYFPRVQRSQASPGSRDRGRARASAHARELASGPCSASVKARGVGARVTWQGEGSAPGGPLRGLRDHHGVDVGAPGLAWMMARRFSAVEASRPEYAEVVHAWRSRRRRLPGNLGRPPGGPPAGRVGVALYFRFGDGLGDVAFQRSSRSW